MTSNDATKSAPTTVVIKMGGNAIESGASVPALIDEVVELSRHGHKIVLVHGAGPFITRALGEAGIEPVWYDGLRQTTHDAIDIIGQVLHSIADGIGEHLRHRGASFHQIFANDAIMGRPHQNRLLGQVGEIVGVDAEVMEALLADNVVVVSPLVHGGPAGPLNVNADTLAAAVAVALRARLVMLTDVDGVYERYPDKSSLLSTVGVRDLRQLLRNAEGGMAPKLRACLMAAQGGCDAVIANGSVPNVTTAFLAGRSVGTFVPSNEMRFDATLSA